MSWREVTGERIRDKIAASKQKGMWMGGWVPIGYDRKDRTLTINEDEAKTVRTIFELFLKLKNVQKVQVELARLRLTTKPYPIRRERSLGACRFRGGIFIASYPIPYISAKSLIRTSGTPDSIPASLVRRFGTPSVP
jgi:hypothetical protein